MAGKERCADCFHSRDKHSVKGCKALVEVIECGVDWDEPCRCGNYVEGELGVNQPCRICGRVVLIGFEHPGADSRRRECTGCQRHEDYCDCAPVPSRLMLGKVAERLYYE